jgi:hypothetical protein
MRRLAFAHYLSNLSEIVALNEEILNNQLMNRRNQEELLEKLVGLVQVNERLSYQLKTRLEDSESKFKENISPFSDRTVSECSSPPKTNYFKFL